MPKKNISQLQLATADQISTNDLFLGAITNSNNYSINFFEFANYLKTTSQLLPLQLTPTYVNLNNINTSVYQREISNLETITFDQYGIISNVTESSPIADKTDLYSGYLNTTYSPGYFDRYTPVQADNNQLVAASIVNRVSSDGTTSSGDWSVLFDTDYSNYRKTIIKYTYQRCDSSNSYEVASDFTVYIYWDGANKTTVEATGIIRYPRDTNGSATVIFPFQRMTDNIDYNPLPITIVGDQATYNKMVINVDGTNKKIKKLPISPFGPIAVDVETHGISITIESFA